METFELVPTFNVADECGPEPITITVGREGADMMLHACPDCGGVTLDTLGPVTLAFETRDFELITELLIRTASGSPNVLG